MSSDRDHHDVVIVTGNNDRDRAFRKLLSLSKKVSSTLQYTPDKVISLSRLINLKTHLPFIILLSITYKDQVFKTRKKKLLKSVLNYKLYHQLFYLKDLLVISQKMSSN